MPPSLVTLFSTLTWPEAIALAAVMYVLAPVIVLLVAIAICLIVLLGALAVLGIEVFLQRRRRRPTDKEVSRE